MARASVWTRIKNSTNAPLHLSANTESAIVNQSTGYQKHWVRGLLVICSQDPGGETSVTGARRIRIRLFGKNTKGTFADIYTFQHQVDVTVTEQSARGGAIVPAVWGAYQLLADFRYQDMGGTHQIHWTAQNLTDTNVTLYMAFDIEPNEEQA